MNKAKYFLFAIAIIAYLLAAQYFVEVLQKNATATFEPFWYIIVHYAVYLILGAALGIEHIAHNRKKEGPWKFNFAKLLFAGIPIFIFNLTIYLYHQFQLPAYFVNWRNVEVATLILGYLVATCFYKQNVST
ncbi:MAG: hypothetical protein PHH05_02370 [Syntrophaceticus sp.]|nr:hypothetical protein [Syntrophaceticus sp.]